ncbi:sugar phosphate nucleotidyltransferase [Paenibacillus protaetiae]|uniref:Uncharacterized protein n=1 Tax=Paenibacillus protaetiae TaxID=2509456 RepID=A0A4P6EYI5_9BACL|nr:sugar phosphate nucleotidyltransferase [Paenibacillus protaetiae]QAY66849.1 hypothetical protein ET464_11045 [Paenibacillus protaetiae]
MKGLILCAGKGTRLQPFTYTRPKCLVPINGEPILVLIIKKMAGLGVEHIGIVVNEATFDTIRAVIGRGEQWGVTVTYIRQTSALGIADAVKSGYSFIQEEPFLLMLGDNLIQGDLLPFVNVFQTEAAAATILLAPVADPSQYGIATIEGDQIVQLEEKPKQPASNLAIVGAYLFQDAIWDAIDQLVPSARGEYEITDALQAMMNQGGRLTYHILTDPFFDVGTFNGWLEANRYQMNAAPAPVTSAEWLGRTDVRIIPPVYIHPSAKIYQSVIGPYACIGSGSVINHCKIENSIIMDQVKLSHLHAADSIIGDRVYLSGTGVQKGAGQYFLGDQSVIDLKNNDLRTW